MNKLTLSVSGMHCHSCEAILERALKKVPNVAKVTASQNKGTVEISYGDQKPDQLAIESIVRENGYMVGVAKQILPWLNADYEVYVEAFAVAVLLFGGYMLLDQAGFAFPSVGNVGAPTLSVAFLVGLTAGVSSCMALVGGIILGVSAEWNQEHLRLSLWHRFQPHLYFNAGRVIGFGLLGGLLGLFGSFIHLSNIFLGSVTVLVGLTMFLLAMNLTGLSPRLGSVSVTLPKFLSRSVGSKSNQSPKMSALAAGAFTFFLPCGFTLAMQAYAVSTGSFMTGMLVMSLFALGTAPGLLGIGGFTSLLSGNFGKYFFRFTGVVLLFLAFFNLSNGYTLLSLGGTTEKTTQTPSQVISSEVQEIRMTQGKNGYEPRTLTIKPNTRIRWIIDSTNPYSCATELIVPSLGISKNLASGENTIEFVSPESGTVEFSCSMGMYKGKLVVE